MLRHHRVLTLAALVLGSSTIAAAQSNPSGHWQGSIEAPGRKVAIEVDLMKNAKGGLAGTFDNPAQNVAAYPLSDVAAEGTTVRFAIKANGGGTFEGVLSADGKTISGTFTTTEGGYTIPFSMTRAGEPRIAQAAKNLAVGKELEGTWTGTIDVEGKQRKLVLTMANHPDGTSTGSIASVDDGVEIPITTITQKASTVTLEIKAAGSSYSGTLNARGTELVGTWNQGSAALPLTFQRAPR